MIKCRQINILEYRNFNNSYDDPKGSIPGVGALAPFILFFIFYFVSLANGEENTENDFIILHQLYGQKKIVVDFDFRKADIEPDIIAEVDFELCHSEEPGIIERKEIKPVPYHKPQHRQFRGIFDMQKLSSGVYQINTVVKDNNGNDLKESVKKFSWLPKEIEKFKWINSKEGITNEVLAPWTPIEVNRQKDGKNLKVGVWGRTYHFNGSAFPSVIETKEKSILAAPIRIIAKIDGKNVTWQWNSFEIEKQIPSLICFNQNAEGEGLNLSAITQIEYDGMIRMDWKITPQNPLKLEELFFEIPMLAKYAKYVYNPGHTSKVGFNYKDRKFESFQPMIWFGDEELGLQWFCESYKDWYNTKATRCVEISPENDVVILRLHLVDKEIYMKPGKRIDYGLGIPVMQPKDEVYELSYTFGLHATPIKPVIKDVWDYRIAHVGHVKTATGTGERFTSLLKLKPGGYYNLDEMIKAGVKTIAFHAHWTDFYGATSTPYVEDLKKLVKACHEQGIQLLLYLGFMMSDLEPAWQIFSKECFRLPLNTWDYTKRDASPMPQQKFYDTCWRSVWQNYYADGVKQMMMEYGIDGVYLDSTSLVFAGCNNTLHGCGFIDPDGKIRFTYQLFDNRHMMQRIYTLVKKYNSDGQINLHNSTEMFAPALSFATSYWDGEHLGYVLMLRGLSENSPILEQMPLDYFRAEFMGHQWGVPAEFLWGAIFPDKTAIAVGVSLLHDVLIRSTINFTLWKLGAEFGRKQAEWLPYWKNSEYVNIKPEGGVRLSSAEVKDVYVSLYKHQKNGVLAVVANLSEVETNVKVQLNLNNLKLKGKLSATDSLSDFPRSNKKEPINISHDGMFELKLSSGEWKVIWVKE